MPEEQDSLFVDWNGPGDTKNPGKYVHIRLLIRKSPLTFSGFPLLVGYSQINGPQHPSSARSRSSPLFHPP